MTEMKKGRIGGADDKAQPCALKLSAALVCMYICM